MSFTFNGQSTLPAGMAGIVEIAWTTTADGAGTITSEATPALPMGFVTGVTTDPGSPAPTDNWDLTISNTSSADVLLGAGADRDTANTEIAFPTFNGVPVWVPFKGALTFAGANNSVSGAIIVVKLAVWFPPRV